jgi:hypothetical protein
MQIAKLEEPAAERSQPLNGDRAPAGERRRRDHASSTLRLRLSRFDSIADIDNFRPDARHVRVKSGLAWFGMVGTERRRRGMRIPAKQPLSIVRGARHGTVVHA